MSEQIIMVGSITYAIKGRDLLRKRGIKAYIERTPGQIKQTGCGYSIYINENINLALNILEQAGIQVYGVLDGDQV